MEIMKVITSIGRRAPHRDGAVEANRAARATDKSRSSEDPVGQLVETSRGLGRDDLTCGRLAGVEGDG
ncbi:hypothetical protein PAXINDRAFT_165150, partial [Paxillus involutus ATCC 200175]